MIHTVGIRHKSRKLYAILQAPNSQKNGNADSVLRSSYFVKPMRPRSENIIGGQYRILRELGKGSSAVVYLAEKLEGGDGTPR